MAKPKASPRFKSPQAIFPVPPFISQAEVVNVLRLRSQLDAIRDELDGQQSSLLRKLEKGAAIEAGPYTCGEINGQLGLWENAEYRGAGWQRTAQVSEVMS